jgi:hypothetical protein
MADATKTRQIKQLVPSMNPSSSSIWGKRLALTGSVMQFGTVLGLIGTCLGMMHAFEVLGESQVGDPSSLSAAIGEVLWSTFIGIAVSAVGAILMCIALFSARYRAPWFFWCLMISGVLWLVSFFPLGLLFLIYGIMKRKEFTRSGDWSDTAPTVAA